MILFPPVPTAPTGVCLQQISEETLLATWIASEDTAVTGYIHHPLPERWPRGALCFSGIKNSLDLKEAGAQELPCAVVRPVGCLKIILP